MVNTPLHDQQTIQALFEKGLACFLQMKQQNRDIRDSNQNEQIFVTKIHEDQSSTHAKLQCLQYERNYYLREIETVISNGRTSVLSGLLDQMKPRDQLSTLQNLNQHQQMLERLENELQERIELENQLENLNQELKALQTRTQQNQASLESLNTSIKNFIQVEQLAKEFSIFTTGKLKSPAVIPQQTQLLPPPLYFLYNIFFHHINANLKKNITLNIHQSDQSPLNVDASGLSETDTLFAYQQHPLCIECSVSCTKPIVSTLSFRFVYLVQLQIVVLSTFTVMDEGDGQKLRIPNDIFAELFKDDRGEDSPNLQNVYLFTDKIFNFSHLVAGRAHRWVQGLCGLSFLPDPLWPIQKRQNYDPLAQLLNFQKETNESFNLEVSPAKIGQQSTVKNLVTMMKRHWRKSLQA